MNNFITKANTLLLSFFLIFTLFEDTNAQIVSATNGAWESGATWVGGGVPGTGDDVEIYHTVTITASTPDGDITDISSILITNTAGLGTNADLSIVEGKNLTVTGNITVTGTNTVADTRLSVSDAGSQLDVGGNLIFVDNNTNDNGVVLFLDNAGVINITGNFNYTKNANPAASENTVEIDLGNSVGVSVTMAVTGDINLNYNTTSPGFLRFELNNTAVVTAANLTMETNSTPVAPATDVDLVVDIRDNSSMAITNTTTFDYKTGTNDQQQIIVDLNRLQASGGATFRTGNIVMNSTTDNGTNNNILRAEEKGTIDVNGGITINNTGVSDAKLLLNEGSTLQLEGNISGSAASTLEFADASVLELNGGAAQTLPDPKADTFQNLIIANTSGTAITLPYSITIATGRSLTLTDGILETTSTELLTIADGGTSNDGDGNSYIDGPVKKIGAGDFIFPTGDGSTWSRIEIATLDGADAATEFTAEYIASRHSDIFTLKTPDGNGDLNNVSGGEYWELDQTGNLTDANVTLYWESATNSEITNTVAGLTDLKIAHYTGSEWENLGNDGTTGGIGDETGTITVNNVTSFSPFTFGSSSEMFNTLPVELLNFIGYFIENRVELVWSTVSETNNDYFVLERSANGEDFYGLEQINGIGNSRELHTYSYSDLSPLAPNSYYRLKQVDYDGTFSYSNVVAVVIDGTDSPVIYPNPLKEERVLMISWSRPTIDQLYSMRLISPVGQVINIDSEAMVISSDNTMTIKLPQALLSSSTYFFLQIETSKSTFIEKVILR